ncbi:GNAT family N-acetyltransferase [Massilia genomosp. 1]|uniref:GNAT family N-acetyltransferase n=1 Tax=Massilia genomosp. 1 TaxID=2609280 RepID=A0ABX0MQ77_9BURK|nr:GNAT family N-acetyltransferase [Massilia genomosp. 1]NHZ64913.1 GNAT family N-acetyltransferase [Massilia genomosp. 1]
MTPAVYGEENLAPRSVLILGSCVSRDAFGPHTAALFRVAAYVARTSWASAFSEHAFATILLDRIVSPFQRRMVELDTGKGLGALLADIEADIILIDLIDERFDLFMDQHGALCTLSPELLSTGFQPDPGLGQRIVSGSEQFFTLWEQGWRRLLELLQKNRLLSRVKVNRVFWSTRQEDGSDFGSGYTAEAIARANRFLTRLYQRLADDLSPSHFIDFSPSLMHGALHHRWGASPFHYIDAFYRHMTSALASTAPSAPTCPAAPRDGICTDRATDLIVLQLSGGALSGKIQWHALRAPQGATLRVDCVLETSSALPGQRADLLIECPGDGGALLAPAGFRREHVSEPGYCHELGLGRGCTATTLHTTLPIGFSSVRIGIRILGAQEPVRLSSLRVTFLPRQRRQEKAATILSVDVEALPGRAEKDSVERLVFGRFGDGKAVGIGRLCDMFEQVGAKATFFVDYSTCDVYGEKSMFEAADYLQVRGHDVQLHMHAEVLVRQRAWPYADSGMPSFDSLDIDVAHACLAYGAERFQRNVGRRPRIFRPGGMKHSKKMVLAIKQAGMEAVSSLYRGHGAGSFALTRDEALFAWDNGILEAPLDFAIDPLIAWGANRRAMEALLERRAGRPLLSILLHSTSLLFRALDNEPPSFTGYCQRYEDLLQEYLAWFAQKGDFMTYSDLLDTTIATRTLALDQYYPDEDVGVVALSEQRVFDHARIVAPKTDPVYDLTLTVPASADCQAAHQRLIPAPQLPLVLVPGQRLERVSVQEVGNAEELAYVLSGYKAYLMRQRCVVPGGTVLEDAANRIFQRHPRVVRVLAQSTLEETEVTGFTSKQEARRTYVLDLPGDFDDYRRNFISKKHRSDMERKERTVLDVLPGLHFSAVAGTALTKAAFQQASELIESRLRQKTEGEAHAPPMFSAGDALRQWEIYQEHGELVQLGDGSDMYAAALCLHVGQDCFFMASGHLDVAPQHSLGNILLYRLIESLIARGSKRLHLGGGDFQYKRRFGATERQLWDYEFGRAGSEPLASRVLTALAAGASPAELEHDLAVALENLLGAAFEHAVGVDFDAVVDNAELGTDGQARRYQATSRDAFTMMMKHIPFDRTQTFVDIGCGKGKMLYYAAQLGYKRCIGVEIAAVLLHQAQANFERLQLAADTIFMHRDASRLDLDELAEASLFYLYNPFSENIMRAFVACLLQSQRQRPRRLYVVYCNALFVKPFIEARFYPSKVFVDGEEGWRFGHAVIYEREPDWPIPPAQDSAAPL